jgi:hypothetical protein
MSLVTTTPQNEIIVYQGACPLCSYVSGFYTDEGEAVSITAQHFAGTHASGSVAAISKQLS